MAVLGAGGSGFAAASLAVQRGASVTAFDSGGADQLAPAIERFSKIGVELVCGEAALDSGRRFDLAVISPGIDTASPIGQVFVQSAEELIGEIEFADRLCEVPIIAITGTNGKTTTTSLIAHLLEAAGKRVVAAGNIGKAYSEVVREGEALDWIVLELSSFQLETVVHFKPAVAVWMNFAPDHMDRYEALEDYRDAKLRLFERVDEETLVVSKAEEGFDFPNHQTFSAFTQQGQLGYQTGLIVDRNSSQQFDFEACPLHGKHNAENVMAALAVVEHLGVSWETAAQGIASFEAPAHRCERVAVVDEVTYINDSKSTNLHSLESALAGEEEPVVLIVGGKQKGLDFSTLGGLVSEVARVVICMGEIAQSIADAWLHLTDCIVVREITDAVRVAASEARPGEVVLFSPGTSSFDQFRGYEERGEAFRAAVAAMQRV